DAPAGQQPRRQNSSGRERPMSNNASASSWQPIAIIVARLIFAAMFIMAAGFKFAGMDGTAGYIAAAGFPIPLFLAWVAAIFESLLVLAFLTGAFFCEASLLAAADVLFLAIAFHGPSHWTNQLQFGAFVSDVPFAAGLLFAGGRGQGGMLARLQ